MFQTTPAIFQALDDTWTREYLDLDIQRPFSGRDVLGNALKFPYFAARAISPVGLSPSHIAYHRFLLAVQLGGSSPTEFSSWGVHTTTPLTTQCLFGSWGILPIHRTEQYVQRTKTIGSSDHVYFTEFCCRVLDDRTSGEHPLLRPLAEISAFLQILCQP
jgi:hypothetical protein